MKQNRHLNHVQHAQLILMTGKAVSLKYPLSVQRCSFSARLSSCGNLFTLLYTLMVLIIIPLIIISGNYECANTVKYSDIVTVTNIPCRDFTRKINDPFSGCHNLTIYVM